MKSDIESRADIERLLDEFYKIRHPRSEDRASFR